MGERGTSPPLRDSVSLFCSMRTFLPFLHVSHIIDRPDKGRERCHNRVTAHAVNLDGAASHRGVFTEIRSQRDDISPGGAYRGRDFCKRAFLIGHGHRGADALLPGAEQLDEDAEEIALRDDPDDRLAPYDG